MNRDEKLRSLLRITILLTLAFIWGHSVMPRSVSSRESTGVLQLLEPLLDKILSPELVTEELVRKMAHFAEYSVLGLQLGLFGITDGKYCRNASDTTAGGARCFFKLLWKPVRFGWMCAFIDETIQIFSGRGPAIADVWLDTFGVITGVCVICICSLLRRKLRKQP